MFYINTYISTLQNWTLDDVSYIHILESVTNNHLRLRIKFLFWMLVQPMNLCVLGSQQAASKADLSTLYF
mgnify:CR=1 FL=1